ncbi:MAG TPA: DUF3604 domain-containing protein [Gammaproteobacteria bacterium]|nr:DUF3604 domain-containing protein [Gammaproteobacteria bacterium]
MRGLLAVFAICCAGIAAAQTDALPHQAYFGDLHLHTGFSFDAIASGAQPTPDDAYRYALGEAVEYMGRSVRRNRPLDFLAVTDHAEYLGVPMGADLAAPQAADNAGMRLVVHAVRDPLGANLDRVQIIKIWRDGNAAREAVFDVAWSDDVAATVQERAWTSPVFYSP